MAEPTQRVTPPQVASGYGEMIVRAPQARFVRLCPREYSLVIEVFRPNALIKHAHLVDGIDHAGFAIGFIEPNVLLGAAVQMNFTLVTEFEQAANS